MTNQLSYANMRKKVAIMAKSAPDPTSRQAHAGNSHGALGRPFVIRQVNELIA